MTYEIPGFKEWLGVYFAEKGHWKLTNRSIEELSDKTARLYTEFAEISSDREREERLIYSSISRNELKLSVYSKAKELIEQGKASELLNNNLITYRCSWKKENIRKEVIEKFLIASMLRGKDFIDLTKKDFEENRLNGLLCRYNSSPYLIIKEIIHNIKPWEMLMAPMNTHNKQENRIESIKWLAKKKEKNPRDLTKKDFEENRLSGLLEGYYKSSVYNAIKEAFPDIKFWEILRTPRNYFNKKENRIESIKWLAKKKEKNPRDLIVKDFYENRLSGLLIEYYRGSPFLAVQEAFQNIKSEEMNHKPKKY